MRLAGARPREVERPPGRGDTFVGHGRLDGPQYNWPIAYRSAAAAYRRSRSPPAPKGKMEIRPLAELRAADDLSLAFNPYGLGGRLEPEDAAEFQHQIADCDLAAGVAAGTRDSFERLRTVFPYGVLCYDVYTLVGDQALLIYEQALRDRFMEWCAGTITRSAALTARTSP